MPEVGRWKIGSSATLLVLSLLAATGCAQDVGDIDRTQPNKVEKSLLEESGEWYFQQTVVDTTVEGQSGVEVYGEGGPAQTQRPLFTAMVSRQLKRVQWEIHQDVLYARSTVEPAEGVTEQVDGEDNEELGIVAAFPIEGHFDVQREYNPQTGEPSNVVVENTSDRPWYEREYMRVDWSTNMVTSNTSVGAGLGLMSPKEAANNERDVPQEDKTVNPDRARIGEDYIGAVTEYVFDPDLYACASQLGYDSRWRCEGGTAEVRNSFWRVDARKKQRAGHTEQVYEPKQFRDEEVLTEQDYTRLVDEQNRDSEIVGEEASAESLKFGSVIQSADFSSAFCTDDVLENASEELANQPEEACEKVTYGLFDRFGIFRTNNLEWSEERHTYDPGRHQFANRWNIWQSTHRQDGSKIAVEERQPRPIVYHLNVGYPQDMFEAADMVEREWNEAFLEAVKLAKGYDEVSEVERELREAGHPDGKMFRIEKNNCHPGPLVDWKDGQGSTREVDRRHIGDIFDKHVDGADGETLEEQLWNISIKDRRRLCAELEWATEPRSDEIGQFSWQRLGDIRHSFFAWINDFNIGWLGYGPSSADPETGEIISASANFAGRALGPAAQETADLVQYLIHQKYPDASNGISREELIHGDHVREQFADRDAEESEPSEEDQQQQGLVPEQERPEPDKHRRDPVVDLDEDLREMQVKPGSRHLEANPPTVPVEQVRRDADRTMMASDEAQNATPESLEWYEQSDVKEQLMSNPMMQTAVGGMAVESTGKKEGAEEESARHQAYVNLMAPMVYEQQIENRQDLLRKHNIFSYQSGLQMAEGLALYTGMVEYFADKSREEIVEYLRKHIFFGTQIHEVGHTVGLRHNFSASLDALNYHDAFWEIEKLKQAGCQADNDDDGNDISESELCDDGRLSVEEARSGGEALRTELEGRDDLEYVNQAEFRLASVMDYTADNAGRFAGLGKYDQAAINFAYADHARVWSEDIEFDAMHRRTRRESHYTNIPAHLQDQDQDPNTACNSGRDAGCIEDGVDRLLNGREWVSHEEAKRQKLEYLQHNANVISGDSEDFEINRQINFNFCSDDREGATLGCETFDWGSNQVEVLEYAFQKFDVMQPLTRYRGASVGAGQSILGENVINIYAQRLVRTLSLADSPFRYFSFYDQVDITLGQLTANLERAARMGLNFYGELLTMPEPRQYCPYEGGDLDLEDDLISQGRQIEGAYVPASIYRRAFELSACERSQSVQVQLPSTAGSEATIASLANQQGDFVHRHDVVAELETDQGETLYVRSPVAGQLEEFETDDAGETYAEGDTIEQGEDLATVSQQSMTVPTGEGQYFSFDRTGEYNYRVDRVGSYVDKLLAAGRMFQLNANFTYSSFVTDRRATEISYWTEFSDPLYKFLRGMFLRDYERFGGGCVPNAEGECVEGNYRPQRIVDEAGTGPASARMPGRYVSVAVPSVDEEATPLSLDAVDRSEGSFVESGETLVTLATDDGETLEIEASEPGIVAAPSGGMPEVGDELEVDQTLVRLNTDVQRVEVPGIPGTALEGSLGHWTSEPPEFVERGERLVNINVQGEAPLEVEAPESGVLVARKAEAGDTVENNDLLVYIISDVEKRLFDPSSFDVQTRAMIDGIYEFTSWQDKKADFGDYLVVAKDESELPVFSDGANEIPSDRTVTFAHPDTDRRLVAARAPDGRSITYELVEWANELKQDYLDARDSGVDEETLSMRREAMENVLARIELIRDVRQTDME